MLFSRPTPQRRLSPRRPSQRRLRRTLIAAALALPLAAGMAATPTLNLAPAEAATIGRMVSIGGWQIGAFLSSNGSYVYCIEPGAVEPSGNQQSERTVSSLPGYTGGTFDPTGWRGTVTSGGLSGAKLRQINYVLWTHGRTKNAGTAAAVQFAVWILRADPGAKKWLDHHIAWARAHGGSGYVERGQQFASEAREKAKAPAASTPESLTIARSSTESQVEGRAVAGTLKYPAGTTELRIEGGVFTDDPADSVDLSVSPDEPGSVEWAAELHLSGWSGTHRVAVSADWVDTGSGWPAQLRLYPPQEAGQQRLVGGIGPVTAEFTGTTVAELVIDAGFAPVLSTRTAERYVARGGGFSDTVTISSADVGSDTGAAWPSRLTDSGDAEFVPVIAEGEVYGPFDSPQAEAPAPPEGAPIAARARLVAEDGPGEYPIEADRAVSAPGYYYWVWRITGAAQLPEVRSGALIPEDYGYADDFGLAAEGQVSPTRLRWKTRLEDRVLGLDELVLHDVVTAEAEDGVWLRDGSGDRVPARLRLTAYQSDTRPERASAVPEDARELAHGFAEVTDPGVAVAAEAIPLPDSTRGWVTVRTCLVAEDQAEELRGLTEEWCDDYGIPAETARIDVPAVLSTTGAGEQMLAGAPFGLGLVASGALALLAGGWYRRGKSGRSARGDSHRSN